MTAPPQEYPFLVPEAEQAGPAVGGCLLREQQQWWVSSVGRIHLQGIHQLCSASCYSQLHESPWPADEARGTVQCRLQGKARVRKECCPLLPSRPTFLDDSGRQSSHLLAKTPLGAEGATCMLEALVAENTLLPGFSNCCGPNSLGIWFLIFSSDCTVCLRNRFLPYPERQPCFPMFPLVVPDTLGNG